MTHELPSRQQAEELLKKATALQASVDREARAARRGRVFVVCAMAVALIVFAGLGTISIQNRQINERLVSCTTPAKDHDCYNEQARRGAAFVDQLVTAQIAVAVCTAETAEPGKVRVCVDAFMRRPR